MSQSDPVPNGREHIADLVVADIQDRKRHGVREYGVALQAHNGRRALWDLYEELLDGAHYVRQRVLEEDHTLRRTVGNENVRALLTEIYNRRDLFSDRRGQVDRQTLEQRYIDDVGYLRHVVESLLVELACAERTPPEPPPLYEIARYQYRCVGPDGWVGYDEESYDQNHVDDWCADQSSMSEGYYMEYRVLLATPGWYRVDPENPPAQPPGAESVSTAAEPPRDDEKAYGSPPDGWNPNGLPL